MKSTFGCTLFFAIAASCVAVSSADELSLDSASTMSCGTNFISVGDSEATVLSTCGDPSFRDGDRWTYSGVQGSFVYQLTFGGGNVVSIHTHASN